VTTPSPSVVTELLRAWRDGDESALARLLPLAEGQLRRLTRRYVARERGAIRSRPTALVHEAFLSLIDACQVRWPGCAHFSASRPALDGEPVERR
jgi:hypothetical protein